MTPHDWSDEILREIFRHAEVGFVLLDLHGTIHEANEAFCRMLGLDRASCERKALIEIVASDQVDETRSLMESLANGELNRHRAVRRYVRSDGGEVTARVITTVVRAPDDEPVFGIELVEDIGPRIAAEQALRDSELRYRRIVEDLAEYVVRWRPDGTRTFVNEAYARYVGVPRDELIGTSFFPLIPHEEDREALRGKIRSLMPDNPAVTSRYQAIKGDGSPVWHEWTDRGFFDDDGELVELQSVGRDVTEAYLANRALQESERRYRSLFTDLPVAAWQSDWTDLVEIVREAGISSKEEFVDLAVRDIEFVRKFVRNVRVIDVNPLALQLYGVADIEEYRRWTPGAWSAVSRRAIFEAAGSLIFGEEKVANLEVSLQKKTGETVEAVVRWALTEAGEREWHIVASALDVTELRATQRNLERQKMMFEHAERIAHMGNFELNVDTREAFGSGEFWSILDGAPRGAGTRKAEEVFNRFHPDDLEVVRRRIEARADEGSVEPGDAPLEFRIVRPDGSARIVQGRGSFVRNEEGRVNYGFGIIRDITEQKANEAAAERQRQQLVRADRLISLGTLVGGVAHEINNPNQFIMLNSPLLKKAWEDISPIVDDAAKNDPDMMVGGLPWTEMRSEAIEISDDILEGAKRINAIVSELRDFARDGESPPDATVSLNQVIRAAQRLAAAKIRGTTSSFGVDLASDLPGVRGQKQRLEQVVINLLLNSCDAVAEVKGEVSVRSRFDETSGMVVLEVKDTGAGIEPDNLERIFDPFFTTKRTEGGTGLGLAICSRIVSEHGGQISVESELGSGTTVYVRLPAGDRT